VLTNYFTLRALVREWNPIFEGALLLDAYSQHKGSLILVLEDVKGQLHSVNLSLRSPLRHVFRYDGSNRSRRNVVDQFPRLRRRRLGHLSIAPADRFVTWHFEDGLDLVMIPFGARANALLVGPDERVLDAFRAGAPEIVPEPSPARMPATAAEVSQLLQAGTPAGRLWPVLSGPLRDELLFRMGGTEDPTHLFETASRLLDALETPAPRLYEDEDGWPTLALTQLHHLEKKEGVHAIVFDSVDEAVRVCARRRLARNRFEGSFKPLLQAIRARHAQAERSLGRVEQELSRPSRADQYEHQGHLLMAQLHLVEAGAEAALLPDLLGDGSTVRISLDPTLTAVENAQRFYEKAKATRASREAAEDRVAGLRTQMQSLDALLAEAKSLSDVSEVVAFQKQHSDLLSTLQRGTSEQDSIPYRRFELPEGYEVWVGRSAKQNDELTLRDARPFDLWMHARGVPGSHTVLRVKGRKDVPPTFVVERAASIAAWFSKARTSSLAPVIVTERKYVRKPRKAPAGTVHVEREKVLLVEPGLPGQ